MFVISYLPLTPFFGLHQIFPMFPHSHLIYFIMLLPLSGGSDGKESTCSVGDQGSIPALGRSPGEGSGHSLKYSGLENSMDCIVHRVAKSWTQLSNFHFLAGLEVRQLLPSFNDYLVIEMLTFYCNLNYKTNHCLSTSKYCKNFTTNPIVSFYLISTL